MRSFIIALILIEILFLPFVIFLEYKAFSRERKCRALKVYSLILAITALVAS